MQKIHKHTYIIHEIAFEKDYSSVITRLTQNFISNVSRSLRKGKVLDTVLHTKLSMSVRKGERWGKMGPDLLD